MKMMSDWMKSNHLTRFGVFLTTATLIAGIAGCGHEGNNPPLTQKLEIHTWYDLDAVRDDLDGGYILMKDLNSTTPGYEELADLTADEGKGWEPIGVYHPDEAVARTGFTGTFDGQGHEIRDLFINRPDEDNVGLFRYVDGGAIEDVGVTNVTVIGGDYVGAVSGSIRDCTVSKSHCSGSVTGNDHVGGIGGDASCTLTDSHFTGSVTGTQYVGGLVGTNRDTVSKSHFAGEVTGFSFVGGLVGSNALGDVFESYSSGKVTGYGYVGGLVGWNYGVVSDCSSTDSVTGTNCVGGLVAKNLDTVDNCYSTGSVTGDKRVGGLVGANYYDGIDRYASISSSFWDIETSGQSTSSGGTGKTTAEMKNTATFSDWNIIAVTNPDIHNTIYIWNIVDAQTYPFLSWQFVS